MRKCLIVDDSVTVRRVLQRIIISLGFEPADAADGKQAIEYCLENMPDVIILDWNMPVMNGIGFLKELRKLRGGNVPKVIFCTSVNDLPQIEEALDAGADEYIMKPFDEDIVKMKLIQAGAL